VIPEEGTHQGEIVQADTVQAETVQAEIVPAIQGDLHEEDLDTSYIPEACNLILHRVECLGCQEVRQCHHQEVHQGHHQGVHQEIHQEDHQEDHQEGRIVVAAEKEYHSLL